MDWKTITDKNIKTQMIKSTPDILRSMRMAKAMIGLIELFLIGSLTISNILRAEDMSVILFQFIATLVLWCCVNLFVEHELVSNTYVACSVASKEQCGELGILNVGGEVNTGYMVWKIKFCELEYFRI